MTIQIACADRNAAPRDYILDVIFNEWLGLPWRRTHAEGRAVSIRLDDADGEIRLPDVFLGQPVDAWLTAATLPTLSLMTWDSTDLATDIPLTDTLVPVIFGGTHQPPRPTGRSLDLPIDIFGSALFMLSRYEEAVLPERDSDNRFPATASLAYRAGFLDRPIIDEYVEILWAAMKRLWPNLERKPPRPRTLVSCDVDNPFSFTGAFIHMGRGVADGLIKRRSPTFARETITGHWRARRGDHSNDPYRRNIDWIMDVNEQAGRPVSFYFIPENTDAKRDRWISLDQPAMRALLRDIHSRGHEIGIHPGYNTYKHPDAMARSVATLRRVLDEEGISQPTLGGRQHYLRWETPTTARLWDDNGLDYDSTLSYADRPGFRCGTCHEYPLYDLATHRTLKLRERPLIVMECSVIDERYMGLGYTDETLALMQRYRTISHQFGGDFTLLWHNSHLINPLDKQFYRALIAT